MNNKQSKHAYKDISRSLARDTSFNKKNITFKDLYNYKILETDFSFLKQIF